jgi:hypothetical protein
MIPHAQCRVAESQKSYCTLRIVLCRLKTSMPQNGEMNKKFGVYKSVCCGSEIVIREGTEFPDCPNHRKLTTIWKSIADEPIPRAAHLPDTKHKKTDPAA